jgi:hypothetical protein
LAEGEGAADGEGWRPLLVGDTETPGIVAVAVAVEDGVSVAKSTPPIAPATWPMNHSAAMTATATTARPIKRHTQARGSNMSRPIPCAARRRLEPH